MFRQLFAFIAVCALCVFAQLGHAEGGVILVTKQNQADLGLKYTLTAKRVSDDAVLVDMQIPLQGKLEGLRAVSMSISGRNGSPSVYAPLQNRSDKSGSWVVHFQVSPEMADKCTVDILGPWEGGTYVVYSVVLKDYVVAVSPPKGSR